MIYYTTKKAAELLGQNWQTISRHCQILQDGKHIVNFTGRYQIDEIGLKMLQKALRPVGWQQGKKRAKLEKK